MPIMRGLPDGIDPDAVPRPVWTVGTRTFVEHWEKTKHHHRKALLILTLRGMVTCEAENGLWTVPPQCALWIPGGVAHSGRLSGEIECYAVFIDPSLAPRQSGSCAALSVTPLFRELIVRSADFLDDHPREGAERRLIGVLMDELFSAQEEKLVFPMPATPQLRRLASLMLAAPAEKATVAQWASRIGLSERSLSRFLIDETGMSFGRWRRQLHVVLALQRLGDGETVQNVALDLGYENSSGFVTMFRKTLGKPPARYTRDH